MDTKQDWFPLSDLPKDPRLLHEWYARELPNAPSGYCYLILVSTLEDMQEDALKSVKRSETAPKVLIPIPECEFTVEFADGSLIFKKV
jgi:hypothetical protein